MGDGLKCPFKGAGRPEQCDKEKCVLWHEGGCAFVHIAVALGDVGESLRGRASI